MGMFPTFPFYLASFEVEEGPEVYSSEDWGMKEIAWFPALCAATSGFMHYPRDQPLNSAKEGEVYFSGLSNTWTKPEVHVGEDIFIR